jgi:OmpA-OmpF porin, OOP family
MKKTLLALCAFLACGSALAQVYVGGSLGITQQGADCAGWSNCDKSDTGLKIYGGYKLTKEWALEAAYTDFGSVSLRSGPFTGSYSATALSAGGAFFLPLAPKLTGIGRFGLASVDGDYSAPAGGGSESGIEPYFGLGVAYGLTPKLSVTGSFDYMNADYPRGSGGATLFAVGLSYAF